MAPVQAPLSVEPVFKTLPPPLSAVYCVARVARFTAEPDLDPAAAEWQPAAVAPVAEFHPNSVSGHRPRTDVRLLHDGRTLRALFDVHDCFVRCVHADYQSMVSRDSCVELFLQPPGQKAYFNFEFNCAGTLLLFHIEDPQRHPSRIFRKYTPVPPELGRRVKVWATLRPPIDPEIPTPLRWKLACEIPVDVLAPFVPGGLGAFSGQWRGNFFKCGDETSHPHWASWSPIGKVCRFHQPDRFGSIVFEA